MSTATKVLHGSIITILALISIVLIVTHPQRVEAPHDDVSDSALSANEHSTSTEPSDTSSPNQHSESFEQQLPLLDTVWVFEESMYDGSTFSPKMHDAFTLSFGTDTTVAIHTDCNTMSGTYEVRGQTLTFSSLTSTRMYCEGSEETTFADILSSAHAFSIEGDTLTLMHHKSGVATFVRETHTVVPPPVTPPKSTPLITGSCFKGGCSGQLCTDAPDAISTCEWRDEYACYQSAVCERQSTGKCGWTQTPTLSACLMNVGTVSGQPDVQ